MEKYDIPEPNSLDSMEGVQQSNEFEATPGFCNIEVSIEVEEMVLKKVKNIFEYNQAITSSRGLELSFWDGKICHQLDKRKSREPLSSKNIREYFSSRRNIPSTIDAEFKFGIQADRFGIAEDAQQYREKNRRVDESMAKSKDSGTANWNSIFFNIEGRHKDLRNEFKHGYFNDVAVMFELPKDTFIIDQKSEATKLIFEKEKLAEDDVFKVVKPKLRFGEFSTSAYSVNGGLIKFFRNNPDLKVKDQRIINEIERQRQTGDFTSVSESFNERGDFRDSTYGEGFMTPKRIAPRKFQGLIIGSSHPSEVLYEDVVDDGEKDISDEELYERTKKFFMKMNKADQDVLSKHFENLARTVIHAMINACKDKPERLVPVYDRFGNLLWPKKISHKEIVDKVKEKSELDTSEHSEL